MKLGSIEAGGTKFVVGVGDEFGNVLIRESFHTEDPITTMEKVYDFFKDKDVSAIGIGSFGPIDLNLESKTYGYITTTPKPGWNNFDILGYLKNRINVPIGFDTDVNTAVLGELTFGGAKGLKSALYLTIGTGIGGGAITEGKLLHGLLHPEMGHIMLAVREDDNYVGKCPFHKTCFEGLASGPAIEERWNINGKDIPEGHQAWDLEAYYIAQAVSNYILILSPEKIILGGGVMHQKHLFSLINKYVLQFLNGYIKKEEITKEKIKDYIIYPLLGDNAGLVGRLALALNQIK